jgi:hypothetical protein
MCLSLDPLWRKKHWLRRSLDWWAASLGGTAGLGHGERWSPCHCVYSESVWKFAFIISYFDAGIFYFFWILIQMEMIACQLRSQGVYRWNISEQKHQKAGEVFLFWSQKPPRTPVYSAHLPSSHPVPPRGSLGLSSVPIWWSTFSSQGRALWQARTPGRSINNNHRFEKNHIHAID